MSHALRRLGESDLVVGPVAFGCWRFAGTDVDVARSKIELALQLGLNLIDTADIYGYGGRSDDDLGFGDSELLLGEVLRAEPSLRDAMVLATKGGIRPPIPYDSSPAYLRSACEDSLRRLGVDRIDLYQVHRPDLLAHPEDTAAILTELVRSGKVRHVGVSNYSVGQTSALAALMGEPIVTTQPEFHLLRLDPIDDGTFDHAMANRVTPLAWSPLAGGRLASPDCDGRPELAAALDQLASQHGVDRSAIAIAAVLAHPSAPVAIIGTQNPVRMRQQAAAADVVLDRTEVYSLFTAAGRTLP